ncbi:phage tail domain-containing protein [uncultured Clostridium sp.]|uniref:phage tail domain-containing protein n=1 Tax=uncultured Clostridium sp. TaxID=59620 RepID=UPI0026233672|nr:phage tail domain-containing protein [uncultured Clostridium sp.]
MLQLHNAKHFMFDGEEREDWRIVNTTNDISFQIGRTKSIETEDGALQPIFKGVTSELPSFNFEIFKVDLITGEPVQMTREDIFDLNRWLDRNTPKPLVVDEFIYWGVFSPQTGVWYGGEFGVIELKFDMVLPYMLGLPIESVYEIEREETITIENDSNVYGDYVYPEFQIGVSEGDTITITNLENRQVTTLNNLKTNGVYIIYNQERQMINEKNVKENIYANSNKKYQNLVTGENRIKISTNGRMTFRIKWQPKICLQ